MSGSLLSIRDLSVAFVSGEKRVQAVSDVSLEVAPASRVGIIGESGSGKTVTALSILRLHDPRRVRYGQRSRIDYGGDDLLTVPDRAIRSVRGGEIGMVFQNPMTSLNPTFTIGSQIQHVVRLHHGVSRSEARDRAIAALREVELPNPGALLARHPHALSGGQRQRVLIAMVLACEPRLIIADEPTSGLDVTVQAGILEMLLERTVDRGISVLMITHDMGVISRFCDEINVMYGGVIVESGPVGAIFSRPRHPYTSGLLRAIPSLASTRTDRLYSIPGRQSQRTGVATRCVFTERCEHRIDACDDGRPPLVAVEPTGRHTACIRHAELTLPGADAVVAPIEDGA